MPRRLTLVTASAAIVLCVALPYSLSASAQPADPTDPTQPEASRSFRYKPDDSVLQALTEEQALDLLRQIFASNPMRFNLSAEAGTIRVTYYLDEYGRTWSKNSRVIKRIEVQDSLIRFELFRDSKTLEFAYFDLPEIDIVVEPVSVWGPSSSVVRLSKDTVLLVTNLGWTEEPKREFGRKLADALYVLKRSVEGVSPEGDKKFAEMASRYRASTDKPPFPEEARRFRVQAESAVREKRLAEAVRLYQSALKIVPWWPEGHFNRSLVLAELNRYGEAISEMKRYLALVPDAPNARAAQDKIYEWEGKLVPVQR